MMGEGRARTGHGQQHHRQAPRTGRRDIARLEIAFRETEGRARRRSVVLEGFQVRMGQFVNSDAVSDAIHAPVVALTW